MKIHEYQAKELFSAYDIPVEKHTLCHTATEAAEAFERINVKRAALKAQVLTGGRGKAGGVQLVASREEAHEAARRILAMQIKELPVHSLLVSEAVDIAAEYYVGLTIDRSTRSVVLMMSASGGIDIEEVAARHPAQIIRLPIDPLVGIPPYLARRYAYLLFTQPAQADAAARLLRSLYRLLMRKDASMVEINPLALTRQGTLIALDGKITFDDNALYRHPDIEQLAQRNEQEQIEHEAKSKGISYIPMEGNVGCMVNGAGLAMATMDIIKLYGGAPANFLDIGGSSNPLKVVEAMKLLLRDRRVQVVLINIFGGITRCDDVAAGLIEAFRQIESDIPVVVRLTGTAEAEGRALLQQHPRFRLSQGLEEATRLALESIHTPSYSSNT
ncbi:MAG: ADP-forming succinate--CoA ligase subunit beta [Prevotellaceae bacterium]|jgi:succinyl-CoA synthetase beta subunit|nr:ADP-forming succinate--CoA ligase subunit beta [Prevotellaceae bacterium]